MKTFAAAAARYFRFGDLKFELSIRSEGSRHSVIRTSWWLFQAVVFTSTDVDQCEAFIASIDRLTAEINASKKYTRHLVEVRAKLLRLI